MWPIIDTHTHIYYTDSSPRLDFSGDIDEVIERAKCSGVAGCLLPNIDRESYPLLYSLTKKYPHYCVPMIGLHPTNVGKEWREELAFVEQKLSEAPEQYIAVGEIGLDYHWSLEHREEMITAFRKQLDLALRYHLPVSIHSRDAEDDVIDTLSEYHHRGLKGVVHSFGGNEEQLRRVSRELPNFMVGVNGTITFKNNPLHLYLTQISIERIVAETDAPFLAPMPYRGKRNEPAYLVYVVKKLAEIYSLSEQEVRAQLFANSEKMFNLQAFLVSTQ